MFVRLYVLFFFFLPFFDETLVTHLFAVPFLIFFHPQAEMLLWLSLLAIVSYASPLSLFFACCCWCCAAFVTFAFIRTCTTPTSLAAQLRCMLPLCYCELMLRFHLTAFSSALTFFFTVIAPQVARISATPLLGDDIWVIHVFVNRTRHPYFQQKLGQGHFS